MCVRARQSRLAVTSLRWLLGAWLFGACHPAPTPPPVAAQTRQPASSAAASPEQSPGSLAAPPSPCPTGSLRLQVGEVGAEVGSGAPGGIVSWLGKLNEDDWVDVIIRFPEGCSSYGECEHSVYLGCGGERFTTVYGPEYSISLKPDAAAAQRPVPLTELRRKDNFEEPGATPTLLQYRDGRYAPAP